MTSYFTSFFNQLVTKGYFVDYNSTIVDQFRNSQNLHTSFVLIL